MNLMKDLELLLETGVLGSPVRVYKFIEGLLIAFRTPAKAEELIGRV